MHPDELERYSFLWSEARLLTAAVALFLKGVPPLFLLSSAPIALIALKIAWIISGAAAGYLLYRWVNSDLKVFGSDDIKDKITFLICVVTGLHLGVMGLTGINIGFQITKNPAVLFVVAIIYVVTALYLFWRWSTLGRKLF